MINKVIHSVSAFFLTAAVCLLFNEVSANSAPAVTPRLMKAFLTDSPRAASAKKRSATARAGEKLYFYYRIGPVSCLAGKGAPFQTKLVVEQNGRVLKDFGWQNANAASPGQMNQNIRLLWYHNAAWNFSFGASSKPGTYRAVVYYKDLNSGTTLKADYPLVLAGASEERLNVKAELLKFMNLMKAKKINFLMEYVADKTEISNSCEEAFGSEIGKEDKNAVNSMLKKIMNLNYTGFSVNGKLMKIIIHYKKMDETNTNVAIGGYSIDFLIINGRLKIKRITEHRPCVG